MHTRLHLLKIHFKGWSQKYDEWVCLGENVPDGVYGDDTKSRIVPLNLYTNASANNPREQEKWQGRRLSVRDADEQTANKKPKGAVKKKGAASKVGTGEEIAGLGTTEKRALSLATDAQENIPVKKAAKTKKVKKPAKIDWNSVTY